MASLTRTSRLGRIAVVLWGSLVAIVFIGGIVTGFLLYIKNTFEGPGILSQNTTFMVGKGDSVTTIAQKLLDRDIISDARVFLAGFYLNKEEGTLKAGEYPLKANASMEQIIRIFRAGKSITYKVTLPEGLTSQQIVERLKKNEILTGTIVKVPAEGTLLPETYSFHRGISREEMLNRMRKAQAKVLKGAWDKRAKNLPFSKPEEALILASIVEKETGKANERPRVAGVFINRLNQSIRLQSDPTIIYGLVGGKGSLGRPIKQSELDERTPYNTYQIDGLPPTPIANPGRAAIEAVLAPAQHKDIYFVADGTGGHAFAQTLAQHNSNVAKWRAWKKKQKTPPAVPAAPVIPTVPKPSSVPVP